MKSIYLKTFGCQMNENDSEIIRGLLKQRGYAFVSEPEEADVILFNTCTIRDLADRKAYGTMGILGRLRRKNPDLVFGILGCMAESAGEKVRKNQPLVDLVAGPRDIPKIPDLLDMVIHEKRPQMAVGGADDVLSYELPKDRQDTVKAWVTIMRGCNKLCSFCIVPSVRGREVSRTMDDVLQEIQELADKGYKEVNLLGQNVNSYGKDLGRSTTFSKLLERVNQIAGIERIRFITSHPMDVRESLIEAMMLEKVCENIHFPIQSGSNRILKLMRRNYTKEKYFGIIDRLREKVPQITLSTDIIVGFPGENDEDFEQTCQAMEKMQYENAYIFKYSPRKNTLAATMPDQILESVKEERHQILNTIQNRITLAAYKRQVGKTTEVLVEGPSKMRNDWMMGRNRQNQIVIFQGQPDWKGRLISVRILSAATYTLYGEPDFA